MEAALNLVSSYQNYDTNLRGRINENGHLTTGTANDYVLLTVAIVISDGGRLRLESG